MAIRSLTVRLDDALLDKLQKAYQAWFDRETDR